MILESTYLIEAIGCQKRLELKRLQEHLASLAMVTNMAQNVTAMEYTSLQYI